MITCTLLDMSVRVSLEEISIWILSMSKEDHPHQCGWTSTNLLRAQIEQKANSLSLLLSIFSFPWTLEFLFLWPSDWDWFTLPTVELHSVLKDKALAPEVTPTQGPPCAHAPAGPHCVYILKHWDGLLLSMSHFFFFSQPHHLLEIYLLMWVKVKWKVAFSVVLQFLLGMMDRFLLCHSHLCQILLWDHVGH